MISQTESFLLFFFYHKTFTELSHIDKNFTKWSLSFKGGPFSRLSGGGVASGKAGGVKSFPGGSCPRGKVHRNTLREESGKRVPSFFLFQNALLL